MTTFSDLGLSRWWNPDDREEVRAANAAHWPSVRDQLLEGRPHGTALTDVPEFRDTIRDAVVHDGWGAEDVAVWFGVSGQRARDWVNAVLTDMERAEYRSTAYRVWAYDRFVPTSGQDAKEMALRARPGPRERARLDDVEALRQFVRDRGYVPRTGEFVKYVGGTYDGIGGRWPGTYAEGWNALYAEAGYDRPGAYQKRSGE